MSEASPSPAERLIYPIRDLPNPMDAERIFVCSGLEEIDASRLSDFLRHAVLGVALPEIVDGYVGEPSSSGLNVVFHVDDNDLEAHSLQCVGQFSIFERDLTGIVRDQASVIGTVPDFLASQPLSAFMGPIESNWRRVRENNWLFISFISTESESYRINRALTDLFRLDSEVCMLNPACEDLSPTDQEDLFPRRR